MQNQYSSVYRVMLQKLAVSLHCLVSTKKRYAIILSLYSLCAVNWQWGITYARMHVSAPKLLNGFGLNVLLVVGMSY